MPQEAYRAVAFVDSRIPESTGRPNKAEPTRGQTLAVLVLRVTQLAATLRNQYRTAIDFVVDSISDVDLLRTSLRTSCSRTSFKGLDFKSDPSKLIEIIYSVRTSFEV